MTQTEPVPQSLPDYLQSFDSLEQHFRAQLKHLSNTQKGDRFAHFVQRLIPQTELGPQFEPPSLSDKKSWDEGVDLIAKGNDGKTVLYVQAKLWVDKAEEIDSIMSKFQAYKAEHHFDADSKQYSMEFDSTAVTFALVTLSRLQNIRQRYEKKSFASRAFYDECIKERRLTFVDGPTVLLALRAAFRKISELPESLRLNLEAPPIQKDGVFISVVSSDELRRLYNEFGDSLFFENVRDFLHTPRGKDRPGRTTPNQEIIKTVSSCPERMLSRNNGIVFRAEAVSPGDVPQAINLTRGSIVNGCQTTMCIVQHAASTCYVPVKIVQTEDSWDIAKAANYQNSVFDIDLDLARILRPQLVKRAANITGVRIENREESAFQIIDAIYDRKVAYEETRLFYIGLFSRSPNNLFSANYTELCQDVINKFYENDPYGEQTFEMLFELQAACHEGLTAAREYFVHPSYAASFDRFYRDDSPTYRCFLGILALCGAVNTNVAERCDEPMQEFERMKGFFAAAHQVLQQKRAAFLRYHRLAVKIWMQEMLDMNPDDTTMRRDMSLDTRRANFGSMFKKLCLEADLDDTLRPSSKRE